MADRSKRTISEIPRGTVASDLSSHLLSSLGSGGQFKPTVSEAAPLSAGEAIRAVISQVDTMRQREQTSVQLKFEFGPSARLKVSLAYRNGEVQATFRTDSPALRETLQREWQVQANSPAERVTHTFFTTSTGGSSGGFGSNGQSQQQQTFREAFAADLIGAPLSSQRGRHALNTSSAGPASAGTVASNRLQALA